MALPRMPLFLAVANIVTKLFLCAQIIKDRRKVLEEQLKKGEVLKSATGRKYLDFLDILLTSKVGSCTR